MYYNKFDNPQHSTFSENWSVNNIRVWRSEVSDLSCRYVNDYQFVDSILVQ